MSSRKITQDSAELHLLERYYHLLVSTDYLRDEVYDFLVRRMRYKEISATRGVNENYLRNIIHKEIQRIYDDITEDPFALVRYESRSDDKKELVSILIDRIDVLISHHNIIVAEDLGDFMVLDLGEYSEEYNEFDGEINEELFYETIERLKYLSKPYLNTLFEQMDQRLLGYVVYLLGTKDRNLSERDKNKKQSVKELWFLPDNE